MGARHGLSELRAVAGMNAPVDQNGDFLIGPDLRIERAHYGRDAGDFLMFRELDAYVAEWRHPSHPSAGPAQTEARQSAWS